MVRRNVPDIGDHTCADWAYVVLLYKHRGESPTLYRMYRTLDRAKEFAEHMIGHGVGLSVVVDLGGSLDGRVGSRTWVIERRPIMQ